MESKNLNGTGGTGGPGAAGPTGQAGGTGRLEGSVAAELSLNNQNQTVEQFALEVAYQGLVGATGGGGGIPSNVEAARQQGITATSMRDKLFDKVAAMDKPTEIIAELKVRHDEFTIVEGKANSQVAYCAFRMGFYLLKLQSIRMQLNRRDWVEWSEKNVGFISKRSREKYMNIAGLPGAELHLVYGVELLSELGSWYSSLSEKDAGLLGNDPIAELLKTRRFSSRMSLEERRAFLEAVIQVRKLERQGIIIALNLMERFLKDHKPLNSDERKFLKGLAKDKDAPQLHMERFIAEKRDRKKFIPEPAPAEPNVDHEGAADDDGVSKNPTIPNIDVQVATLDQSLEAYLKPDAVIPGGVDAEALERMAERALELAKKLKESKSSNVQ